jgi:hypothetical protein
MEGSSVADFEASRNETLARRMRTARATGQVPQWGVGGDEAGLQMREEEVMERPGGDGGAEKKGSPPPPPPSSISTPQCALVMCVLASVVIVALLVKMMAHNAKYEY